MFCNHQLTAVLCSIDLILHNVCQLPVGLMYVMTFHRPVEEGRNASRLGVIGSSDAKWRLKTECRTNLSAVIVRVQAAGGVMRLSGKKQYYSIHVDVIDHIQTSNLMCFHYLRFKQSLSRFDFRPHPGQQSWTLLVLMRTWKMVRNATP